MQILTIADTECKSLWDYYQPGKLAGVDIILSCGDLDPRYLSFLATFTHAPVYYVHGNHDEKYDRIPPDGCICLDDDILIYEGVRILGLGGSLRYRPGKWQYEQDEMNRRVRRLKHKLRKYGGFDILMAHAPARHIGDGDDRPHQGFTAFTELMDKYHPRYFLHGHVHPTYSREYRRLKAYGETLIINAYDNYRFEYEKEWEEQYPKLTPIVL
ncbi:MAG: metallophosphoesterase family protein [Lachnospiraceae bacterium]|nr:metallophosphoesterase family protein [Lachnospiraceae bacterium]